MAHAHARLATASEVRRARTRSCATWRAQPFIKDEQLTVDEVIRTTIAQVGENIRLKRFARFVLGEETGEETND